MTMDYFCREDMKMIPPKNLTEREKENGFPMVLKEMKQSLLTMNYHK